MRVTFRRSWLIVWIALALPGALAAQAGSIAGKVVDQEGGRPLVGARVQAAGANYFAYTTQEGTYRILGVAPGAYSLRVIMLGYGSQQKLVTVGAGQAATADWSLTAVPFTLEEIVTTATGEQLRRELGH